MNIFQKLNQRLSNNLSVMINRLAKYVRKFYREQHQLTSVTGSDRYPQLFSETVKVIGADKSITMLSFGCSSGEECFSLKRYFPKARIIGVDINKLNLKKARRANQFSDVEFLYSSDELIQSKGPYDMIFCLSVLCRWEDTLGMQNCEKIYPFEKYNATVEMLARQVKGGGLLVIYNSNFRFEDTPVSADFEILETPSVENSGFVTKFDRNNNVMSEVHRHCLYRRK